MDEKVPNLSQSGKPDRARRDYVLNQMIPEFFQNMDVMMRNGSLYGVTGQWIEEAFPLPEGFQPFSVMIDTSRTGTIRIKKTRDLFNALYLTWWHNRRVDLDQVFQTFSAIDTELAAVVKREFQRLFTRRTVQKVIDPRRTGREYLDR